MSTADPSKDFTYCCHTCQAAQTTDVLCPRCGPSRAHFVFAADDAAELPLRCEGCGGSVAKGGRELQKRPRQCQYCRSTDLGWRSTLSGEWRPETSEPGEDEGPWVRGDFDGDIAGTLVGEFRKLGSERGRDHRYALDFPRAQLENVALVDGPPVERQYHDQAPPLRFRHIDRVYIYRQDGDDAARVYRADLVDVRLHDWTKTIDDSNPAQLTGRLQGVAYARLRVSAQDKPPEPEKKRKRPKPSPVMPQRLVPEEGPDAALPPSPAPAADAAAYCNTCNLFVLGAVFLLLYIGCRWQTAVVGVLVMALQCWWRSRRLAAGRNRLSDIAENIIGALLVLLAVLTYLGARYEECLSLSLWWLLGMALLLLLTAVLRRCWPWLLVSLLWVLMLLSFYCKSFSGECAMPAAPAETAAPAASPAPGLNMPALGELNPLPSLQAAVSNVVNGVSQRLAIDQDSHSVEDENSGRVSLDQALANPAEFFSCDPPSRRNRPQGAGGRPYDITFSEAALFETNEATLRPGADAHLRKLARLFANSPDLRIVLTGHADHSGTPQHNLDLSRRRAQSVADWLVANGYLKPEQIDVRGAGDLYPIVNDPRLYRYNRRVDLSLDCSRTKP